MKQCKACPWKVSTVPERDIPGGYCADKHHNLQGTIAEPGSIEGLNKSVQRVMACHESSTDDPRHCVGWLYQQLTVGNNIALRMQARDGRYDNLEVVGEQHERFEDTLPRT